MKGPASYLSILCWLISISCGGHHELDRRQQLISWTCTINDYFLSFSEVIPAIHEIFC